MSSFYPACAARAVADAVVAMTRKTACTADEAARLAERVDADLSKPAALMLPASTRQCIRELVALVLRLAVEVERCEAGIRSK